MANKFLTGNGYWCSDCGGTGQGKALDRVVYGNGAYCQFYERCPTCDGDKRIAATPEQIITGTVPITSEPAHHSLMLPCMEWGL